MTFLAHATHWATSLLYFAPVLALAVWLGVQSMRERRRGDSPSDAAPVEESEPTG